MRSFCNNRGYLFSILLTDRDFPVRFYFAWNEYMLEDGTLAFINKENLYRLQDILSLYYNKYVEFSKISL